MSLALSAPDGVRYLCERVYRSTAIPLRTLGYYELFLLVVMT